MTAEAHEVDAALVTTCAVLGFAYWRRDAYEITNEKALQEAGLMILTPHWREIRRRLHAGKEVEGVRATGVEYVLRKAAP
jgi:hypothetical protein